MRLFLAQPASLEAYALLRRRFSPCLEGRWRTETSLHATVLFLGERFAPDEVVRRVRDCDWHLDDAPLAGFGTFERNRIFYARCDHPTLVAAHGALRRAFGMPPDGVYLPHVTLMRYKRLDAACVKAENAWNNSLIIGKAAGPMQLMKSTLTPEGAVYETLYAF